MIKQIWINLPANDVTKSKDFFLHVGFKLNENFGNGTNSASLLVGDKNIVLMLFSENIFKSFIQHEVANTTNGSEVLFSIDAESREEVDELAKKVADAGGIVFAPPGDKDGWMYGCGFSDLDGHRWNVLYMDFEKMPR